MPNLLDDAILALEDAAFYFEYISTNSELLNRHAIAAKADEMRAEIARLERNALAVRERLAETGAQAREDVSR